MAGNPTPGIIYVPSTANNSLSTLDAVDPNTDNSIPAGGCPWITLQNNSPMTIGIGAGPQGASRPDASFTIPPLHWGTIPIHPDRYVIYRSWFTPDFTVPSIANIIGPRTCPYMLHNEGSFGVGPLFDYDTLPWVGVSPQPRTVTGVGITYFVNPKFRFGALPVNSVDIGFTNIVTLPLTASIDNMIVGCKLFFTDAGNLLYSESSSALPDEAFAVDAAYNYTAGNWVFSSTVYSSSGLQLSGSQQILPARDGTIVEFRVPGAYALRTGNISGLKVSALFKVFAASPLIGK